MDVAHVRTQTKIKHIRRHRFKVLRFVRILNQVVGFAVHGRNVDSVCIIFQASTPEFCVFAIPTILFLLSSHRTVGVGCNGRYAGISDIVVAQGEAVAIAVLFGRILI